MQNRHGITFGNRSTVAAYDEFQVPTLFRPWATLLADSHDAWRDRTVLDLATGSGIVAEVLAPRVGAGGQIIGVDISDEMLELARKRCAGLEPAIMFVRSAAHPLELPDASVDVVVCQQGFQFFPDQSAAAAEIHRVLRPGGKVMAATWRSLAECDYFLGVRNALACIGEPDLAARMHIPFNRMPADELLGHFSRAGFEEVQVGRKQLVFTFPGGMVQALATARATVAGPEIEKMPDEKQAAFDAALKGQLRKLTCDGHSMGRMVSNLLTAVHPKDSIGQ